MSVRIDIVLDQGAPLNQTIYRVRDADGGVVDLSTQTGYASLKINYTASNSIPLNVSFNQNGDVILQANLATMQSIDPSYTYVYDVFSVDPVSNVATKQVWGVADINPVVTIVP